MDKVPQNLLTHGEGSKDKPATDILRHKEDARCPRRTMYDNKNIKITCFEKKPGMFL